MSETMDSLYDKLHGIPRCERCEASMRMDPSRREDSRPFRRANVPRGFCANCVMTQFLYNTYPVNSIIDESGPELLLKPSITEAFLRCGYFDNCEMDIASEIDWAKVVANWSLPVEVKKSPLNPYRMGDSPRSHLHGPRDGKREPTLAEEAEAYVARMKAEGFEPVGDGSPTLVYGDGEVAKFPTVWTRKQ